jgi:serine/threonine protein kinase
VLNQQFGDYKFLSVLGEGGIASVYLGENISSGKRLAIKVFNDDFGFNNNGQFNILPIKMLLVDHPNIIESFDLIDLGDNIALTMEYIEGVTLNDFVLKNGPLNPQQIKNLITQLINALKFLHDKQIIHGLINPQNIFLNENGFLKVDLSHYFFKMYNISPLSHLQGARCFITPEEFLNGSDFLDEKSDVYSVGLILFYLLTASLPNNYCGFTHMNQEFNPLPTFNLVESEIELYRIIEKACRFEKNKRYQNMNEFENDFDEFFSCFI